MDLSTGRRVMFVAVTTLAAVVAQAEPAAGSFEAAQAQFERGRAGDAAANERASEQFKLLSEKEPGNPLYLAYYGSTLTMAGRDAWAPWNKWRYTERGLDLLDKAVGMLKPAHDEAALRGTPLSVETLLVAASTFLGVPRSFHHFEAGKAAVAMALECPVFGRAPAPVRSELWFQAALVAREEGKRGDEVKALQQALALAGDGPSSVGIRQRLKDLGA
jgi:hypothetical protein